MNNETNWYIESQSPWYDFSSDSVVFAIYNDDGDRYVFAVWDGAINDYAHQEDNKDNAMQFFEDNRDSFLDMVLKFLNEYELEDDITYIHQETFNILF